jgi:hypothetical protein
MVTRWEYRGGNQIGSRPVGHQTDLISEQHIEPF